MSTLSQELIRNQNTLAKGLMVLAGVAVLWLSAKIQVPFYPVPMTMQTFVVLVLGLTYGRKLAVATIGAYLLAGAFGIPVFAGTPEKGIGLAYMFGTTGGYLFGFLMCGMLMGWLGEKGWHKNHLTALTSMILGSLCIYAGGVIWLSTFIGFDKALTFGVYPFLLADAFKILLAAATISIVWKFTKK